VNLDEIMRTARRPHLCGHCGLTVWKDEKYVRAQDPNGGRVAKKAFHSKCYAGLVVAVGKGGR